MKSGAAVQSPNTGVWIISKTALRRDSQADDIQSAFFGMQIAPKGDLVLVEVAKAETKTTGGVLLPSSAQKKPTSGGDANGDACRWC